MASRKRSAGQEETRDDDVYENKELDDAIKREKIGKLNATDSPLLRLPGEIRNMIYEYALSNLEPVYDCGHYPHVAEHPWSPERNMLSPLFVCRQMHAETALLPYKLNVFKFRMTFIFDLKFFLTKRSAEQIRVMSISIIFLWDSIGYVEGNHSGCELADKLSIRY